MIQVRRLKLIPFVGIVMFSFGYSIPSFAICADIDAITETDKAALAYFRQAETFQRGKVLKRHLPSNRKETASYIKDQEKYYTFFGLVELDCTVKIMKRTHARN